LVGEIIEQFIVFLYGSSGANGKTTICEAILHTLKDYAGTVPVSTFLSSRFGNSQQGYFFADMRGRRIIMASEIGEYDYGDSGIFKHVSGNETIVARNPFGRPFQFKPSHSIFISTNNLPVIPGHDSALMRRILIFPFEAQFVDNPTKEHEFERDPHINRKIKEEGSGILAWMIQGYLRYRAEGWHPPKPILRLVDEYGAGEDILGQFLKSELVFYGDELEIQSTPLHEAFIVWYLYNRMGSRPPTHKRFAMLMKHKPIENRSKAGCSFYFGLSVNDDLKEAYEEEISSRKVK
jgi:putative DNA primase/helicase